MLVSPDRPPCGFCPLRFSLPLSFPYSLRGFILSRLFFHRRHTSRCMRRASIGSGASWETACFSSLQSVSITLQHPKLCSTASLRVWSGPPVPAPVWLLALHLTHLSSNASQALQGEKQRSSESRDNLFQMGAQRLTFSAPPRIGFPDMRSDRQS